MKMFLSLALSAAIAGSLFSVARAATPPPAQGGSNQMNAVSGCANKWLFNGVWRLKVDSMESDVYYSHPEWKVTVELRNGTSTTHQLMDTGVDYTGIGWQLVDSDGNASALVGDDFYSNFSGKVLNQGQGVKYKLLFRDLNDGKPAKLIMPIKYDGGHDKVHYSVKDPSFRVDLTCGMSG